MKKEFNDIVKLIQKSQKEIDTHFRSIRKIPNEDKEVWKYISEISVSIVNDIIKGRVIDTEMIDEMLDLLSIVNKLKENINSRKTK